MNRRIFSLGAVLISLAMVVAYILIQPRKEPDALLPSPTIIASFQPAASPAPVPTPEESVEVVIEALPVGSVISSPLKVEGKARGPWYFEATFPVTLLDAAGNVIVQSYAQANGEWMTTEFVPFTASLIFAPQPSGAKGTLVIEKSNPSDLPENAKKIEIPVVFK